MLASSRHVRSVELVDASKLTYAHEFVTRWWYAYDAVCARYKMRSIELTQSDSITDCCCARKQAQEPETQAENG